jgi:hypothetical protein
MAKRITTDTPAPAPAPEAVTPAPAPAPEAVTPAPAPVEQIVAASKSLPVADRPTAIVAAIEAATRSADPAAVAASPSVLTAMGAVTAKADPEAATAIAVAYGALASGRRIADPREGAVARLSVLTRALVEQLAIEAAEGVDAEAAFAEAVAGWAGGDAARAAKARSHVGRTGTGGTGGGAPDAADWSALLGTKLTHTSGTIVTVSAGLTGHRGVSPEFTRDDTGETFASVSAVARSIAGKVKGVNGLKSFTTSTGAKLKDAVAVD